MYLCQPCSWSCQWYKTSIVYPIRNDDIYFIYIVLLACQNFPLHLDTWNSLNHVSICNFRSVSLILLQLLLELIPDVILDRNHKHSNSIQYYHSSINDAMMFFFTYVWTWAPVFPLHFRAYVLHIAYLDFYFLFLSYCMKENCALLQKMST